jgi:C4-dicarboxylate-specific signal transduction histidine kinase
MSRCGLVECSFTDEISAQATFHSDVSPEVLIFECTTPNAEAAVFLENIWEHRHARPVYAFVIGTESESDELMQTVGKSAHDFLTLPLPAELLKAKIEIARQIVVDQRVLAQSNEVIERYAHHIDRISADRARQLFHAERLSTIGTMSAGLAHEIKNPLGYIATSLETTKIYWQQTSELLTDEKKVLDRVATEKLLSKVPRALERISNGLERIDKLMQGLNNFARSSQGEKQLHNLNDSVTIALEIAEVHLKYHVIVETELSPDLSLVKVDPQQTQQVLINLLINASHALEGEKNGTVTICSFEDSDHVIVTITDNGPGIPDNHLKNIWQPFYTTKAEGKGTGLGLSISQNLIRDNGGTISVRNRAPKGAQFRIEFPKSSSEPISHSLNPKNTDEE